MTDPDHARAIEIGAHFDALGRDVLRRWARHDGRLDALPDVAMEALARAALPSHVSVADVLAAHAGGVGVPLQPLLGAGFAQPAMTMFAASALHVDVYCYYGDTVMIHDHGFTGGFQVLAGPSLHSSYGFHAHTVVDRELAKGTLVNAHHELLRAGAVRPITSGGQVHCIQHLARPSATIVIRTYADPDAQPQHVYSRTGLRLAGDGTLTGPAQRLRAHGLQALASLVRCDPERAARMVRQAIAEQPLTAAFLYLRTFATRVGVESAAFAAIAEDFARVRGPAGAALLDEIREHVRTRRLLAAEPALTTEVGRLLLGGLLHVDTRHELDALVRDLTGTVAIDQVVMGGVRDLAQAGLVDLDGPLALVVELMLGGTDDPRAVARAVRARTSADAADAVDEAVFAAHAYLRDHASLKVLFS